MQSCRPRIIHTGLFQCKWMEASIWTTSSVKTYRGSCKGTFSLWPALFFNTTPHPWQWIHAWSIQQKTDDKSRILFENFCKMPYIQLPLYQNVNGPNCYYFRPDWMHYYWQWSNYLNATTNVISQMAADKAEPNNIPHVSCSFWANFGELAWKIRTVKWRISKVTQEACCFSQ